MELIVLAVCVFAVIGGFSVVAAITPNESDNKQLQKLLDTINVLGANVYNAANQVKEKIENTLNTK